MTKQINTILAAGLLALVLPVLALAQTAVTVSFASPSATTFNVGQNINFGASVTGGNSPYSVTWNFGDGTSAFGESYSKSYASAGTYTVTVTASDFDGVTASATRDLTIKEVATPPFTASIVAPTDGAELSTLHPTTFQATASGGTAPYSFTWNFGDGTSAFGDSYSKNYTATGTYSVIMTASDFDGKNTSQTISVKVLGPVIPPNSPTVTLTANGQNDAITVSSTTPITLAWSSANVNACTASGDWSGVRALSGSETVGPFAATSTITRTFVLSCSGEGGSTSDLVTVTITGNPHSEDLVISNVRVTNVTTNSATIAWDTNQPANSRVIYDTVSHPSLAGASAPNFGYQWSTATDATLVTSHQMTVTGLATNTKYFFRVISEN